MNFLLKSVLIGVLISGAAAYAADAPHPVLGSVLVSDKFVTKSCTALLSKVPAADKQKKVDQCNKCFADEFAKDKTAKRRKIYDTCKKNLGV